MPPGLSFPRVPRSLVIGFVLTCALGACAQPSETGAPPVTSGPEVAAVRKTFERYRAALLDQDGGRAARWVTGSTLTKYQEYRRLALRADRDALRDLSLIHRMTVLIIRLKVPGPSLKQMNGRGLFVYAVDQGLIGESSVVRQKLGTVTVSGDDATADASTADVEIRYTFAMEGGRWKLDLRSLLAAVELPLKEAVRQSGLSEDEALFELLEAASGRSVGAELWEPLE